MTTAEKRQNDSLEYWQDFDREFAEMSLMLMFQYQRHLAEFLGVCRSAWLLEEGLCPPWSSRELACLLSDRVTGAAVWSVEAERRQAMSADVRDWYAKVEDRPHADDWADYPMPMAIHSIVLKGSYADGYGNSVTFVGRSLRDDGRVRRYKLVLWERTGSDSTPDQGVEFEWLRR